MTGDQPRRGARDRSASSPGTATRPSVDVGARPGRRAGRTCALAHPHLTGIGFDLPPVQPIFEEYVASFGLQDRLSFAPGDFFTDPLPEADVIVMGHILHDWELADKKIAAAREAYDALPEGGALIVYEAIIDDERRENAFGLLMSLNMLIETRGGFDYTGADCRGWMPEAGFRESSSSPWSAPIRWWSGSSRRRAPAGKK